MFEYGYEYLGCYIWFVIIFLIDRCFLILIGVFNFYLNGVLVGLVGIGKMEIVKDFVKVMSIEDKNFFSVKFLEVFVIRLSY